MIEAAPISNVANYITKEDVYFNCNGGSIISYFNGLQK